jgi:predicted nucleotidyltransferase
MLHVGRNGVLYWQFRSNGRSNAMAEFLDTHMQAFVTDVSAVPGVDAIVLGGSRARGVHTPDSDVDIGVYYGSRVDLDIPQLDDVLQRYDDEHRRNLVAGPGGWGAWVNGGAWLTISGVPVDIILRDTQRVHHVVAVCEAGALSSHYQPGHPHAYHNVMYMGELAICQLLWDGTGELLALKHRAMQYPDGLRRTIISTFGFEMRFSCELATKAVSRGDTYYLLAHVVRSVSCLNQVLFAVNRQYCINEKGAVAFIEHLSLRPAHYQQRVTSICATVGSEPAAACAELAILIAETTAILD